MTGQQTGILVAVIRVRDKKVIVVMPAYNAAKTLQKTYDEVMAQEIVDLVVIVDHIKKLLRSDPTTLQMREILRHHAPFGITSVIYQELLQGAKSEKEYTLLKD